MSLNEENLDQLFKQLSRVNQLFFFDHFFPQISDPGAYVDIQKYRDKLIYRLGNHGWRTDWKILNKYNAIRFVLKNSSHNRDTIRIHNNADTEKYIEQHLITDKYYDRQLTEVFKSVNYKLYEVNGYYLLVDQKPRGLIGRIFTSEAKNAICLNKTESQNFELKGKLFLDQLYSQFRANSKTIHGRKCVVKYKST
ncbi:hypothetical protein E1140_02805 [Fulvivirga lutimaris]|nr:hypothetical protein [Fulvivirga lutimaris]